MTSLTKRPQNTQLDQLIAQYQTLCRYCDEFFTRTVDAFREHMQCAQGCASCCVLETVVPLEASMIESSLNSSSSSTIAEQSPDEPCVFLRNNACTIYPVRPIICRTHGLPLLYPEQQEIEVCPLNFTDLDIATLAPSLLLDAESITENLMRLNLAFCMLTGTPERAGERIPLKELLL